MKKWFLGIFALCIVLAHGTTLVKDGRPAAVLVVPKTVSLNVMDAAKDFIHHIKCISGAELTLVNTAPAEGEAVILTSKPKDGNFEYESLGRNGFVIRNDGNNIVICGSNGGLKQALYYILEEKFGVRWLWPGPLGMHYEPSANLSLDGMNVRFKQPVPSTRIHTFQPQGTFYKSEKAWKEFYKQNLLWLERLGFDWDTRIRGQHSFGHPGWKYAEKYIKTHPEYFNMLPDGTRRPNPYHVNGQLAFCATCPTSEGLLQQVLKDWREKRAGGYPWGPNLFLGERDANGSCCCENCLAADRSDDPNRLEKAKKMFAAEDPKWTSALGNVTERYMQFYVRGLEEAKKIDPNVKVVGWANYANYDTPPRYTKLNKDIVLCFVSPLMYPWTEDKIAEMKKSWKGWSETGASLVFRPNFMLDGHCMPINFARKLHSIYRFCLENDMVGTEFDSNTGQFGGNGFNYYVLGRMTRHPELSFEEIQNEYCSAFGDAAPEIREYLDYWEKISDSQETVDACKKMSLNPVGVEVGNYNCFFTKAPLVYTPEVMAKGFAILDRAAAKAKGRAAERVAFLHKGLTNANLTLIAQRIYDSGDKYKLALAVRELDKFRDSIEDQFIAEMGRLKYWENVWWDRTALNFILDVPGERLKDEWIFSFDPEKRGEKDGWFKPEYDDSKWESIGVESGWEMQEVGKRWRNEHKGYDYDGAGWYRINLDVPKDKIGMDALLTVGAVDEACKIWVNGKLALDRPYPYNGDTNSWSVPFSVDISEYLNADGRNVIAIKVVDTAYQGGIWRPVYIKYTKKTGKNLIMNPDFEDSSSWPSHVPHGKFEHGFSTDPSQSGKRCYKMKCLEINPKGKNPYEKAWMRVYQKVKIQKSGKYYFTLWFKTDSNYAGQVRIWVLGKGLKKELYGGSSGGEWKQMEIPSFDMPEGIEAVTVYLNVLGAPGTIYFDNVKLSPIE